MTEPDEKPDLFLPKTTIFFTSLSLLLVLAFVAAIVLGIVLLLELHWLFGGVSPGD